MRLPTIKNRPAVNPLDLTVSETDLSLRTINTLEKAGIFTVRDLLQKHPNELLTLKNFGNKGLKEIYKALANLGFKTKAA